MGKDSERKESISADDLKAKFKEQIGMMGRANVRLGELQRESVQVQALSTKANGAAESAVNLLAEIIGKEEAEKFAQEILNPKSNGKQTTKEEKNG